MTAIVRIENLWDFQEPEAKNKKVRLLQILIAANKLLAQYAYKDINLDPIADKLHFIRSNMAH